MPRLVSYFTDANNNLFIITEKLDEFKYSDNKIKPIFEEISKIHDLGIVHKYIKPESLALRKNEPVIFRLGKLSGNGAVRPWI